MLIYDLTAVLLTIPGIKLVEQVNFTSSLKSQIQAYENYNVKFADRLEFEHEQHPAAVTLTSEAVGEEYERAIKEAAEKFRTFMIGKQVSEYYPLAGPMAGCGVLCCHILLDGVPVRVVVTYSGEKQGYITSFDSCYVKAPA